MKFAFSTLACPKWDFATIAAKAHEYGYDGVEIRAFLNENILTTANVFLTDPAKVRQLFARAGVAIACLSTSVAMTGDKARDRQAADELPAVRLPAAREDAVPGAVARDLDPETAHASTHRARRWPLTMR